MNNGYGEMKCIGEEEWRESVGWKLKPIKGC